MAYTIYPTGIREFTPDSLITYELISKTWSAKYLITGSIYLNYDFCNGLVNYIIDYECDQNPNPYASLMLLSRKTICGNCLFIDTKHSLIKKLNQLKRNNELL